MELPKPAIVTDDTQMTLYTVDGLVEALEWANSGVGADANAYIAAVAQRIGYRRSPIVQVMVRE